LRLPALPHHVTTAAFHKSARGGTSATSSCPDRCPDALRSRIIALMRLETADRIAKWVGIGASILLSVLLVSTWDLDPRPGLRVVMIVLLSDGPVEVVPASELSEDRLPAGLRR